MRAKDALGRYGEDHAAQVLIAAGMSVVDRNWRCAEGELDLVAVDRGVLVAVEVKTRRDDAFGGPLVAVTPAKLARLRGLAVAWCRAHGWSGPVRIDVIAIWAAAPGRVQRVEHVRGVA